MRVVGVGHLLFALGFAVVGSIGLAAHDFVLPQQPVPKNIPWREGLAVLSGALLLLTAVGLAVTRTARLSILTLTAFLLLWVLALQVPRVVSHPLIEARWLGLGEDLTLVAGGWLIFCGIAAIGGRTVHAARVVFGIALIPIGLSHFFYLGGAAEMIPAWMPWRVSLTAFTGAAHIAAGMAIAFGVLSRLAATLEAVMEGLFTFIVWGSTVLNAPTDRDSWVNFFISTALTAAAWAVAESYHKARVARADQRLNVGQPS